MTTASIITSTAVDLSLLPAPTFVEPLDFEAIRAAMIADLTARWPGFTALVESDPAIKLIEVAAYRELLLRQRIVEAARAVTVAYATGADLDHLAALFGVARLTITPADPDAGTAALLEDDEALRRRVLTAPDSYSVAGPSGAYIHHAMTASGEVRDAAAVSPAPGDVTVAILARAGDGTAPQALLDQVAAAVGADTVRPLTDRVTVRSAKIIPFEIEARLWLHASPAREVIEDAATQAVRAYLARVALLGRDVARTAIIAALHVAGVQRVELVKPAADIAVDQISAAHATSVSVTVAGMAE